MIRRLIAALRRHPVLFVRTPLPHDVNALSSRYLEALLRECRSLPAR
jgi:hypothetical protein